VTKGVQLAPEASVGFVNPCCY